MKLQKNKDFFLFKTGNSEPGANDAFLTDGNVSITTSPVSIQANLVGEGKGNTLNEKSVKENVPITLSANLVFIEPTDIASGMPQAELFKNAGFEQEIDTTNNKIMLYPKLQTNSGTAAYYKGGVMKYVINQALSTLDISASASDTKVVGALNMAGTYNPADVSNTSGVAPVFVKNDYFTMTGQSYVTVNGEQRCPFGDISLSMQSQINTGDDSRVCTEIVLEDFAPVLTFSEVLDSSSNLQPITNWLNDSNVTISFPLFSKNYKMEIKINAGIEMPTESAESGLKWLTTRKIRLMNDANDRPFEIVVTPI